MYSFKFLLLLLSASYSYATYSLDVHKIFPEELIRKSEESVHHPDAGLDISQFLDKYGYPLESHEVTTEDGYILTMHRIPHGKNELATNSDTTKKPAILLMHGLLSSSMDWVNPGPGAALALLLADGGYDIWMGNNRGNTWSKKHLTLDPEANATFWDFSFEECGFYDLPASIDYILKTTGHDKITYVGFSQGTSQFFAMASLRPEYNEKINLMTALAPVAYMQNLSQPLFQYLSNYVPEVELLVDVLELHWALPYSKIYLDLVEILCYKGSPTEEFCASILFFLSGFDAPELDPLFVEVVVSNAPAGISMKMLMHYLQEINSGYFRRYDYGLLKNLGVYHEISPPSYNISAITAPVGLFYGKNDLLAAVSNVQQLAAELPNLVEDHLVEYDLFTHLDFIWAKDANTIVYKDVIALLNKYNNMDSTNSVF